MNKSEGKAYKWLLKQGIPKDVIVYRQTKSPDFVFTDRELKYEVKRLYGKEILISKRQLEILKSVPGEVHILAFSDESDSPVAIMPVTDIDENTEFHSGIIFHWTRPENVTFYCSDSLLKRFDEAWKEKYKTRSEAFRDLMRRFIDENI